MKTITIPEPEYKLELEDEFLRGKKEGLNENKYSDLIKYLLSHVEYKPFELVGSLDGISKKTTKLFPAYKLNRDFNIEEFFHQVRAKLRDCGEIK